MQRATWPVITLERAAQSIGGAEGCLERADAGATAETLARELGIAEESAAYAIATAYFEEGNIHKARAFLEPQLARHPDLRFYQLMLRILCAMPQEADLQDMLALTRRSIPQENIPSDAQFLAHDLRPDRVLTLGFLCSFIDQPVARQGLEEMFRHLDRTRVRVVFFSHGVPVPPWLRAVVDRCLPVPSESPKLIAQSVMREGVDILLDLDGILVPQHATGVFQRRPAPVQASWWNTPFSTCLDSIRYFFVDEQMLPPRLYGTFKEKIVVLRQGFSLTMTLPELPVAPAPSQGGKSFVFGSFTALFKLNDAVLATWMEVLRRAPESMLVIKYAGAQTPRYRRRIAGFCARAGVDPARVHLWGSNRFDLMMQEYGQIDLALSPWSYGAGTTALNALWMGVPSICIEGNVIQNRSTPVLMRKAGLPEFIAANEEDYVAKAVHYALHPQALWEMRQCMRPKLTDFTCYNPRLFAQDFEQSCRAMWHDWLQGMCVQFPESIHAIQT